MFDLYRLIRSRGIFDRATFRYRKCVGACAHLWLLGTSGTTDHVRNGRQEALEAFDLLLLTVDLLNKRRRSFIGALQSFYQVLKVSDSGLGSLSIRSLRSPIKLAFVGELRSGESSPPSRLRFWESVGHCNSGLGPSRQSGWLQLVIRAASIVTPGRRIGRGRSED